MSKPTVVEHRAIIYDDGVVRGKVPVPVVKSLGGKSGDYLVFHVDIKGDVTLTLSKQRKQSPSKSKKRGKS